MTCSGCFWLAETAWLGRALSIPGWETTGLTTSIQRHWQTLTMLGGDSSSLTLAGCVRKVSYLWWENHQHGRPGGWPSRDVPTPPLQRLLPGVRHHLAHHHPLHPLGGVRHYFILRHRKDNSAQSQKPLSLSQDGCIQITIHWQWQKHLTPPLTSVRPLTVMSYWLSLSVVRYVSVLHATWLVNSAAHMFGMKPYDTKIGPVENMLVSVLAMGEGFHNYHHTFPYDYSTSEWGLQFNITTAFIDLMAGIGERDLSNQRTDSTLRVCCCNYQISWRRYHPRKELNSFIDFLVR